jgi:hypothetical protein
VSTLTFANGTYHYFTFTQENQATGGYIVQNMFFDINTKRLKYVTVDGQDFVFESTLGLQPRTYTNDFDPYRTCPQASPANFTIDAVHHQALKEHLSVGLMAT